MRPDITTEDMSITELIEKFPHHVKTDKDNVTLNIYLLVVHLLMIVKASGHTKEDLINEINEVDEDYKVDLILQKAN